MQVDVGGLEESDQGWNIRINVILTTEELSQLDYDALKDVEDFKIETEGNILYFNGFLSIAEPWEDEPLEELLKAIKLEIEYRMNRLLVDE